MVFINKKVILIIFVFLIFIILTYKVVSLPTSYCIPENCPEGYYQSDKLCNNGTCYVTCSFYTGCNTSNYTTIYTDSENLPNLNIPSYDGSSVKRFQIANYSVTNINKCYRFRQSSPYDFISSSDIDDYSSVNNFDSGIAFYWIDDTDKSRWYDNQNHYDYGGSENDYIGHYEGAVWIDSCRDSGDNFDSADIFLNFNSMYCAPNEEACNNFHANCDTECYSHQTELYLSLDADLSDGLVCNDFTSFNNSGSGLDSSEIDFVNFNNQTVYMYVDEYNAILNNSFNNTCEYWTICNPADPCCDQSGNFKPNGTICRNAHNATCNTFDSSGCDGEAYEDRCTGTSSQCPDNNYLIDYDEVCTGIVCSGQSCSGSTFQPERTCNANSCQTNQPYSCSNNLNCLNSTSCKTTAISQSDCKTGFVYDSNQEICWGNESLAYNLVYDDNGNLLSDHNFNYSYNSLNQLSNVTNKNSGTLISSYFYDDVGIRIKKVIYNWAENTTTYYFDNFVQMVNSSGIYNETYYYYYNMLVGKKDNGGNILFYHQDHLGGTSIVTNISGDIVNYLSYSPFGEVLSSSSNERYAFTGHELDPETGLIYMKARYYNPVTGQFLQADNLIGDIYNSQDLNKYSYARNSPYTYTDPNGEFVQGVLGFAAGWFGGQAYSIFTQLHQTGTVNWEKVFKTSLSWGVAGGVATATFGVVSPALGGGALAGIGAGTTAGVASGEAGFVTQSILSGNIGALKDPIAHAEAQAYGGILGGVGGAVGSIVGGKGMGKIPKVSDPKLQNYVNAFYKGVENPNRIGSGTTADAIRHEIKTGETVHGYLHTQKGQGLLRGLNNWVKVHSDASVKDTNLAKSMVKDLQSALGGNK